MTRVLLVAALCGLLAACATHPAADRVMLRRQFVPVAEPCSADPGPPPAFADTPAAIAAARNIYERARLYAAARQQRLDWEARLVRANAGCRPPGRAAR